MKTIFVLIFLTILYIAPVFADRKIYLKTERRNSQLSFSFLNFTDSIYIQLVEGYHSTEGGGWIVTPKFLIKPTAPDDQYTVFVNGEQKQTGWLRNGIYSGYTWQPGYYDDEWIIIHYKNGKKHGAEKTFRYNYKNSDYFLATFQWYDNDQHPVETTFYPSGTVARYDILNHFRILIGEDNTLCSVSENGCEWRTLELPLVKGQLDGVAQWFKGGNGIGTQWFRITFIKNRLVQWELQEAVKLDSLPVIAHYRIHDN